MERGGTLPMWSYGKVKVHWLGHDGYVLEGHKVVTIDPFKARGMFHKADVLLITHEHFDHLSPGDISVFASPSTKVVAPKICRQELSKAGLDVSYIAPGSEADIQGVKVRAVPAYNINKFREPGVVFHPKEDGRVGYIVTLDGVSFYHAGDTDNIPEMKGVSVDVALLPVSGTYVMTAEEAAQATTSLKAKVVIPMHYGKIVGTREDAEKFKRLLSGSSSEVVILAPEG